MKTQQGMATIDLLMWMAAFFFVGSVIVDKGDYLMDTAKIWKLKGQIGDVTTAVQEWGSGKATLTGLDMTDIEHIVPGSIGDGAGTNAFGGNFTVAPGAQPYQFVITATGVPARAGDRAAAGYASASYNSSTSTVTINMGN